MNQLRIGLSQLNLRVGDIKGNTKNIKENIKKAESLGVDILCFPELSITGYPPEDLLLKPKFINDNIKALREICKYKTSLIVIVGFVDKKDDIYNAAAIIQNNKIVDIYHKSYLPNYGVFDENRYFQIGKRIPVYQFGHIKFGVTICEDIWYPGDPIQTKVLVGKAQIIFNLSSSPYFVGKPEIRERMLRTRARDYNSIICFCNLVGGQDELVFDGNSMIIDERGHLLSKGRSFEEDLIISDVNAEKVFRSRLHDPRTRKKIYKLSFDDSSLENIALSSSSATKTKKKKSIKPRKIEKLTEKDEIFNALVLGTRDYIKKNGFKKVVLGLSGGIDSSLCLVIAIEAIGKSNVIGVLMPSIYSSKGSVDDSILISENLGIKNLKIPIEDIYKSYIDTLSETFSGTKQNVTEENLQARIRGNILMALSNKFGWLVLTTGNKSEISVGYTTLYGDMAGGFAILKDVPKTLVYELSKFYNEKKEKKVIPDTVLNKPPSAELRPDQKDIDTLPEYHVLDRILKAYVEEDLSMDEIVLMGENKNIVRKILKMVDLNEYKRRQSPPGIKITSRAFGKDRRFPITNLYKQ